MCILSSCSMIKTSHCELNTSGKVCYLRLSCWLFDSLLRNLEQSTPGRKFVKQVYSAIVHWNQNVCWPCRCCLLVSDRSVWVYARWDRQTDGQTYKQTPDWPLDAISIRKVECLYSWYANRNSPSLIQWSASISRYLTSCASEAWSSKWTWWTSDSSVSTGSRQATKTARSHRTYKHGIARSINTELHLY